MLENPLGPLQEYEVPPEAVRLIEEPSQTGELLLAAAEGKAVTETEVVVDFEQPLAVTVTV